MKILHVVPGLAEKWNGIAVAARLIAQGQREAGSEVELVETREFVASSFTFTSHLHLPDEVWVHSNWWPLTLRACWKVIDAGVPLVRMTHANLDPVRYRYHWWKKALMSIRERRVYRRTARVIVTCEAEREWCEQWGVKGTFEIIDLKRFFDLGKKAGEEKVGRESRLREKSEALHVLYIGRNHPLKGVRFLQAAVEELNHHCPPTFSTSSLINLRIVSNHFCEELERDWEWADVLCLPTLSENFGLVVAEALERGKRVITTDGAPAWDVGEKVGGESRWRWENRLIYLRGYRDGSDEERVKLLKGALEVWMKGMREEG